MTTARHLRPGHLTLDDLFGIWRGTQPFTLADGWREPVAASARTVAELVADGAPVYGVNTGFGKLAHTRIADDQLETLQRNLLLSHAVGTGPALPDPIVRLALGLKIASLARGASGVRPELIDALIDLLRADMLPVVPALGSVGASGDLAPLSHLVLPLLGVGTVRHRGQTLDALAALQSLGRAPLVLGPKEGLALINGTQISTAIALHALFGARALIESAAVIGALSVDAARGSDAPFDERIHALRGQPGQIRIAAAMRALLAESAIRQSHLENDERVQDPYSLRCQPQVLGACVDLVQNAQRTLCIEANAVTDNPLVFAADRAVLSGGNFHAEPVAFAADTLALAIAETGAIAERRIALLIDASLSGLPPFLVAQPGLHSGFMIAHVTAAALASENKAIAHPRSVDSLPTSANQEDHVSMATGAAWRLLTLLEHTETIVAIEWLAAAQGIDLHAPLSTSPRMRPVVARLREHVEHWHADRWFAPDIEAARTLLQQGRARVDNAELLAALWDAP
jgi:histidine ammonia-lyase